MKYTLHIKDALFSVVTLVATFALNLLLQSWFHTQSLIPMIFVLGVFLISWRTQGYFWVLQPRWSAFWLSTGPLPTHIGPST